MRETVQQPIYLDHQASTPVDPEVVDAMSPWLIRAGNPHSDNPAGRKAAGAIEKARSSIADLLGADSSQIVFTSGATEASNLLISSLIGVDARVVTSPLEHACILEPIRARIAETMISYMAVNEEGLADPDSVAELLKAPADLVCLQAVNNEIGTVQPIAEVASLCRYSEVPFLCDMSQSAGRLDLDVTTLGISASVLSSHKIYGPQGIGALFIGEDLQGKISPLVRGGGQERALRGGTLPTFLCVGFGKAAELARKRLHEDGEHARRLRHAFLQALSSKGVDFALNGSQSDCIPHCLNISLCGVDADALVSTIEKVSLSTGSACQSGSPGASHVLKAIALSLVRQNEAVRVGFGRDSTMREVEMAAQHIAEAIIKQRPLDLLEESGVCR